MTMTRGGHRPGSGRTPGTGLYGEPTKTLRVPESQVTTVVRYLSQYRRDRTQEPAFLPVSQAPAPLRLRLVENRVPAGFPSPAQDYVEDDLDLNEFLIRNPVATFVMRVKGESLRDIGILDGDYVVIDRSINPVPGMIVIAAVDGEFTIKELGKIGGRPALVPHNREFQPIVIQDGQELLIWGVVTSSFRKMQRHG